MRVLSRARRLVALGAGIAVGLAAFALPAAHADTSPPNVFSAFESLVLSPGTAGKVASHQIGGNAATPTTFTRVTVTYDVTGLAGVATLIPQSGHCTTVSSLITCHVGDFTANQIGGGPSATPYFGTESLRLKLVPAAGAPAGASGTIAATVSAASVPASSSTISVSLADGPDIQVMGADSTSAPSVQVSPATAYYRAVKFTNVGDQAAQGVTLEITAYGPGVDVPELRKNCQYSAPTTAYCYIPDLVAPGASETLSPAVELLTDSDLMHQLVTIAVVPGYAALPTYAVGTGKPFTLVDASGAAQQPVSGQSAQTNIDFADSRVTFNLNVAAASADLAATASVDLGPVPGQWAVSPVSFNNGPGFIELGRSGFFLLTGDVVFPAGVTVVSVPSGWQQVPNSTPGVSEYQFIAGIELAPDTGDPFAGSALVQPQPGFAGANGTFTIGVNNQPPSAFAGSFIGNIDSNPANDTVTFAIPAFGS